MEIAYHPITIVVNRITFYHERKAKSHENLFDSLISLNISCNVNIV